MKNTPLNYFWIAHKGYVGVCRWQLDIGCFYGDVPGLRDVITFQGKNKVTTIRAFRDSVNDYLAFCKERGEPPEKMKHWMEHWR